MLSLFISYRSFLLLLFPSLWEYLFLLDFERVIFLDLEFCFCFVLLLSKPWIFYSIFLFAWLLTRSLNVTLLLLSIRWFSCTPPLAFLTIISLSLAFWSLNIIDPGVDSLVFILIRILLASWIYGWCLSLLLEILR